MRVRQIVKYSIWLSRWPILAGLLFVVCGRYCPILTIKLIFMGIFAVCSCVFLGSYFRYMTATDWKIELIRGNGLKPPRKNHLYKCVYVRGKYRPLHRVR